MANAKQSYLLYQKENRYFWILRERLSRKKWFKLQKKFKNYISNLFLLVLSSLYTYIILME